MADFKPRLKDVDKNFSRIEELGGKEKVLKDNILSLNEKISQKGGPDYKDLQDRLKMLNSEIAILTR